MAGSPTYWSYQPCQPFHIVSNKIILIGIFLFFFEIYKAVSPFWHDAGMQVSTGFAVALQEAAEGRLLVIDKIVAAN